jgi:hypothetical protein
MPDGQLSAATIEYEDIGEPGITGPNRREGRNRIKQEAAYATGTDQQKAPGGGRSLALPAAQAGAPPGPARPRRRSSQGPAAEVASMSTQIQPAPARAPTSSAGPTCHRPRPAAREASVCSVVPHRAGVVLLLPDRIGRGASGHRARHRLAGRATPGRRLLRPCGRSLQADGRAHWRGRRPAGRWATRTSKVHETPSPAAQARGSVAGGRGCCRWPVPTSPACALTTWICEPAGLLALTTLTGYASRVRRCWPKCPAGGGRGGRQWPRNTDGGLSPTPVGRVVSAGVPPTPSWAPCCRVAGLRWVKDRSGHPGGATSGKMSPIEIRQQR